MNAPTAAAPTSGLPPMVAAMLEPSFYPHRPRDVELVQTHISFVFLAGDEVFKVKKPVKFSFLDFSTAPLRLRFCREEVRVNRRLAADVYRGVSAVCSDGESYWLGEVGDDAAVDYAVRMKRLPADRMFSALLARGEAGETEIDAIAERLVAFHAEAAAGPEVIANGAPETLREVMVGDFSEADRYRGVTVSAEDDRAIREFCLGFVERHADEFRARQAEKRIRECHGDLRAEHICFADGISMIDGIEFDAKFRNRDVAAEIAFLAMDIEGLGHPSLSDYLIARYAALSGDAGLSFLVPFYQCYFAYIRGKVESLKSLEPEVSGEDRARAEAGAGDHFAMAHRYTWAYSPLLIAVIGLSGSGKSTVARALRERIGFAHVNSDVVRKELAGVPVDRRSPRKMARTLYSRERSRRTYEEMMARASSELGRGRGAIVDATFQRREERRILFETARRASVPLLIVECGCGEEEIRRRLERRVKSGVGPSDADWEVYRRQREVYEGLDADERMSGIAVDSAAPGDAVVAQVERAARAAVDRHVHS